MIRNNALAFLICLLSFFTFFAGIIRHDVPEEKYLQLAREKQFDCVGQVFLDTSMRKFDGSCVLISERFVLSAAHVFIVGDSHIDTVVANGRTVYMNVVSNTRVADASKILICIKGMMLKVKRITIHPQYLEEKTKGTCDLALIELGQPLKGVMPASLNKEFDELTSRVVGVGFGASGRGDKPDEVGAFSKKIAGENIVDAIIGTKFGAHETLLQCDFDHPTRSDLNKTGSSLALPLEYLSSGGDSGGGLFRQRNNHWELVGICSGGGVNLEQLLKTGYYGHTMQWTRVSAYADWVNKVTH